MVKHIDQRQSGSSGYLCSLCTSTKIAVANAMSRVAHTMISAVFRGFRMRGASYRSGGYVSLSSLFGKPGARHKSWNRVPEVKG